jgi:hypothetical protein
MSREWIFYNDCSDCGRCNSDIYKMCTVRDPNYASYKLN